MSHMAQGLSFNPLMINNEACGNLEQTLFNDLNFSTILPHSNKFASSIDHYSSNCFMPPNCKIPSTTVTSNLSPNTVRSTDELQALSINPYLPFNIPQHYAYSSSFVAPNQSQTYLGANEFGFSNLFSLDYSFPDYRDFGSKNAEELCRVEQIDERKKDSCLPYQFQLKQSVADEQIKPQESVLQREHLSWHEPPYPTPDQSLLQQFNSKELNSFAYNCPPLIESSSLTSDCKFNNWLSTAYHKDQIKNSDFIEETSINRCRFTSSETKINVQEKSFPEEKEFISNPTEKPVSSITHKNYIMDCSSSDILCEAKSTDIFKEKIFNKPGSLQNEDKREVVWKDKLDHGELDENPNMQDFSSFPSNIVTKSSNTLSLNSKSKLSLIPETLNKCETPDQSLKLDPQDLKNSTIPSVSDQNQENFSDTSTAISCQQELILEDSVNKERQEFGTNSDTLPVECDSTTESNLQPTDLSSNSLQPNKVNVDIPFDLENQSFSKTPKRNDTSNKCRICKEFLLTEKPMPQQFTVPIDANFDVCNACNICFLQKSVLSSNSLKKKNQHKCSYCERDFKKECYLILHLRTHSIEKPFKCSKCNKAFTNSAKLKLHSKNHSVFKPFSCNECGKRFMRNSHLKMHMKVHFGKKPFKCEICLKDYESRSKLSEHEKYHSPKLPFKCATCEKSFVKKTYFESHLRIHCNAKPFECSMCKTCFAQKSILRQHTKNCKILS